MLLVKQNDGNSRIELFIDDSIHNHAQKYFGENPIEDLNIYKYS